jgi:t-SNARE complex subunit (syntaxin)
VDNEQLDANKGNNNSGASYNEPAEQNSAFKQGRVRRRRRNRALRALLWLCVTVIVIIVALVLASIIAGFNSVMDMFVWIADKSNWT